MMKGSHTFCHCSVTCHYHRLAVAAPPFSIIRRNNRGHVVLEGCGGAHTAVASVAVVFGDVADVDADADDGLFVLTESICIRSCIW